MSTYTLKCGCVALVEFERLVTQCSKHEAEWKEIHERAVAERKRGALAEGWIQMSQADTHG